MPIIGANHCGGGPPWRTQAARISPIILDAPEQRAIVKGYEPFRCVLKQSRFRLKILQKEAKEFPPWTTSIYSRLPNEVNPDEFGNIK